jgi:hypothetical protein
MAEWAATRREVSRAELGLQARLEKPRKPGGWAVIGGMPEGDIEAIAALVLMQASKGAQEDLKAIMAGVKAVHSAKAKQREMLRDKQRQRAAPEILDPDAFVMAVATLQVNAMLAEVEADTGSVAEMGEMQQLRLQMAMDRLAKMMNTLSNLLKKMADTQASITGNMK